MVAYEGNTNILIFWIFLFLSWVLKRRLSFKSGVKIQDAYVESRLSFWLEIEKLIYKCLSNQSNSTIGLYIAYPLLTFEVNRNNPSILWSGINFSNLATHLWVQSSNVCSAHSNSFFSFFQLLIDIFIFDLSVA